MKRRALTTGLGVLTVAAAAGFILHTPARSRLSAVPSHAHVVYNDESADWFLSFFPTLGKTADNFSKHWKKSFQFLETRPLAVATTAFGDTGNRPAWVAVSELTAAQATALRWRLMLLPPDGISAAPPYAVWPVWRFEHPLLPAWARVRFVITERLLICSVSADSRDVYRLLDVADGRTASLVDSVVK